ncbi:MAG TPA: N-acetyl-gamma-glutamyl-phosphate reductase [Polyangiaceae bacterium]|nr:N-acetyl-gamma-glutamyl-phosphate reductase [Polyangiaceae bacterium]
MSSRVAVVGARGHTGSELLPLIEAHPALELAWIGSRSHAGERVTSVFPGLSTALSFSEPTPETVGALDVEAVVLALPNGLSEAYLSTMRDDVVVIDLSADHRFDPTWAYGLPELFRERLRNARRIANPGCYATAAQLALHPLKDRLSSSPRIFGVSGFSGAGTTPSPRNDPERLRDNLMPYGLVGHVHEREIGHHLGRGVRFMPHVAPFFRGITLTIDISSEAALDVDEVRRVLGDRYGDEPLVVVQEEAPLVRDNAGRHHAAIGGVAVDGERAVLVATIDNLLKGAATQALQNLALALGHDEHGGIPLELGDSDP